MSRVDTRPKLRFAGEFSEQDAFEAQGRGYLSHVMVELEKGCLYPICFYDVVRLQQDLAESSKHGRPFIADPGMIVVEEISLETMEHAIERLWDEGFFEHLTPVTPKDVASGSPYQWPPYRPHAEHADQGSGEAS